MPIILDEGCWRTDFTVQELIARVQDLGLPSCLVQTIKGNAPYPLTNFCEGVSSNAVWPLQDDFVPVWTCNGTSCMAYEPSTGKYTYQHIEDLMDEGPEEFASFPEVRSWVFTELLEGRDEQDLQAAKAFLEQ